MSHLNLVHVFHYSFSEAMFNGRFCALNEEDTWFAAG